METLTLLESAAPVHGMCPAPMNLLPHASPGHSHSHFSVGLSLLLRTDKGESMIVRASPPSDKESRRLLVFLVPPGIRGAAR